jgi:hypothetical protein
VVTQIDERERERRGEGGNARENAKKWSHKSIAQGRNFTVSHPHRVCNS